jgi:DNA-binding transcriptional LysR family regulator
MEVMERVDDLRLLVRIIETGSLSAAARDGHMTQPTVSKRLRALEDSAGARLLQRNTRHVQPTEAGLAYFQHCKRWLTELDELKLKLKPGTEQPKGPIRVASAVTLGACVMTRIMARFRRAYPQVSFALELSDRRVDLVEDRVDVAIRVGGVGNPDLIATPLGAYGFAVAASPHWLAQNPEVRTLTVLMQQPVMTYDSAPTTTLEGPGGPVVIRKDAHIDLSSSLGLRQLALDDEGPVLVARFVIDEDLRRGDLVEPIGGISAKPLAVFAVTLPVRPIPLRIKIFVAFLKKELLRVPGWVA